MSGGEQAAAWPRRPTTRFAPAPTGKLHLGHVVNAIWVWGAARALAGRVLLRVEDHDRQRCRAEYGRWLLEDLEWLGLEPDAPPERQSGRTPLYEQALGRLEARGFVYVCRCSRRDVEAVAEKRGEELRYPGTCRGLRLPHEASTVRRIRLEGEAVAFDDLRLGRIVQQPAAQCGDLLAIDRGGNWTYQFAVTVDDLEQQVDLVIRGEDLLASTGRQIQLARLLGRSRPPAFFHHELVRRDDGTKLSKAHRDEGIRDLRAAGWPPARVLGAAARAAGLVSGERRINVTDLAGLVGPAIGDR